MGLGIIVNRAFRLPSWITPALCFNNTTALPLLLIESLQTTGILERLLMSDSDSSSAALIRAKSYFLVNATVGDSLTFALGPKLLDGEDVPEQSHGEDQKQANGYSEHADREDEERGNERLRNDETQDDRPNHDSSGQESNEHTSLLPNPVVRRIGEAGDAGYWKGKKIWDRLPPWAQIILGFGNSFLKAPPLIGAIIGAILGLVPPLHKVFFNEPQQGGVFSAWLTDSVKKIGELFAALQIVVVGVKLSSSLRKMKLGEDSGRVPWMPTVFVLFVRFVLWPA